MTPNQEQLTELLSAYLDGEVTAREREQVERTLRTSPGARTLLEELRATVRAVHDLPRHPAPQTLAPQLDAYLERAQLLGGPKRASAAARSKVWWAGPVRAAAMMAIVIGAGWWYLSFQHDRQGATPTAMAPSQIDSGLTGSNKLAKSNPDMETQLAAGVDPVVLVSNSFEPEQVRLNVVARNAGDRDALAENLTVKLAEANVEDLAQRTGANNATPVGAFFIEGKAGRNYADANQRQVLVRIQSAEAEKIIDKLALNGKASADKVALQAGPVVAQGTAKAKGVLQMLASKDSVGADDAATLRDAGAEKVEGKSTSASLFGTLMEIVGLEKVVPEDLKENSVTTADAGRNQDDPARGISAMPEVDEAAPSAARGAAKESRSATRRPLVESSLDRARATQPPDLRTDSAGSMAASNERLKTDSFITMVIEFVLPSESAPPAKRPSELRKR